MAKAQAQKAKKGPDFFSKVASLKRGAKVGILVGGLVAMAAGFYTMYLTPWQQKRAALQTEVDGLTQSIATEQGNINKHKPIADYVVPVSNTYAYLKNYLTTDDEIPKLMQIVNDLGSQSGATVKLFAPKAAVPRTDYAEIQFTLNLEGPYLNILKFFYSLSQMDRLINITSVSMENPILTDNSRIMMVSVRCEASTYRTLNPGETAAAK
jgi:Tfp pilus assembly protein PilO